MVDELIFNKKHPRVGDLGGGKAEAATSRWRGAVRMTCSLVHHSKTSTFRAFRGISHDLSTSGGFHMI